MLERRGGRRSGRRLRGWLSQDRGGRAWWVLGREQATPAVPLETRLRGTPYRDPVRMGSPERVPARHALEFCGTLAELLLRSGAGTAEVESAVIASGIALGLPAGEFDLDVSRSSALIVYSPADDDPLMVLRVVRGTSRDHSRLVAAHRLVAALVAGEVDRDQAAERLSEVQRATKPWPRWLVTLAWGGLAASAAVRFGGGLASTAAAFGVSCCVDVVGRVLARRGLQGFFLAALGALLVTVLAIALHVLDRRVVPGVVVAGGLVVLLPGLPVVAAMQDGVRGFPVTAVSRVFSAALTIAALLAGVALALRLGQLAGRPVVIGNPAGDDSLVSLPLRAPVAALGALCAGLAYRLPAGLLLPTAVTGGVGYSCLVAVTAWTASPIMGTGAACVAVGLLAGLFGQRCGVPAIALVVPATSPLLPGLALFEALQQLVAAGGSAVNLGLARLVGAGAVALSIGTGVVLGEQLAAVVGRPVRRDGG